MGQRKPNRAKLLRPWCTGIQHPPGDIQMSFSIAVIERVAALRAENGSGSTEDNENEEKPRRGSG
jgi:hypothetical protein